MKKVIKTLLIFTFISLIIVASFFAFFSSSLYGINSQIAFDKNVLLEKTAQMSLFDNDNEFVETASINNSTVELSKLPDYVKNAFISIEDKDFYSHNGLNLKRMVKAVFTNLKNGYTKEGASTISQQLIKNTYLTNEKTLDRKIKEILLTLKLEREFSKDDILESYLNVIYFGNSSYGINSAAKTYFNKDTTELTLPEMATLAGIIKSPLKYSPFYNLENSFKRRNLVLSEMLKDKVITASEYENAVNTPLTISLNDKEFAAKRIYEKAALEEASKILNLSEKDVAVSNLKVFTYMDQNLQEKCEQLLLNKEYYHKNEYGNIADSGAVVIDNKTGGINAFYGKTNYNLVTMKRSPGSVIKPILVYAPALEYGKISPTTPILDEPINLNGYEPNNVGGNFYGWVTSRNTIEKSLNIPAIKILQYVGIERGKAFANKLGIEFDKNDTGYSIALGGLTKGVSLIKLTNAYIPFSNGGHYINAHFVKRIENGNGKVLYENFETTNKVISEETAYLMTDMLMSGVKYGTSQKLKTLPFEVAGKTGTVGLHNSSKNSDAWSIGYTKNKSVGVWLGNSTGEVENQLDSSNNGGTYASMLLRDILNNAEKEKSSFFVPSGIVWNNIDLMELKENHKVMLANKNTPEIYSLREVFNKKYAPTEVSSNFTFLSSPILNVDVKNNEAHLTFEGNNYITYELYKVEEDETKLLETIKEKSGTVTIIDKKLEEDTVYEYYLIAKQTNNITNEVIVSSQSKHVKVILQEKEKQLIEELKEIKPEIANKIKEEKPKKKKRILDWFF